MSYREQERQALEMWAEHQRWIRTQVKDPNSPMFGAVVDGDMLYLDSEAALACLMESPIFKDFKPADYKSLEKPYLEVF